MASPKSLALKKLEYFNQVLAERREKNLAEARRALYEEQEKLKLSPEEKIIRTEIKNDWKKYIEDNLINMQFKPELLERLEQPVQDIYSRHIEHLLRNGSNQQTGLSIIQSDDWSNLLEQMKNKIDTLENFIKQPTRFEPPLEWPKNQYNLLKSVYENAKKVANDVDRQHRNKEILMLLTKATGRSGGKKTNKKTKKFKKQKTSKHRRVKNKKSKKAKKYKKR